MKASKTVTTIFAAATLVGAISLAYAQASYDVQPAEPTQEQQLQPAPDGSQAPLTQAQDANGRPAGTLAAPAETTSTMPAPMPAQTPPQAQTYDNNTPTTGHMPVPDNSAPLITERTPRADRN